MSRRLLVVLLLCLATTACGLLPGAKTPAPSVNPNPTGSPNATAEPSASPSQLPSDTPAPTTSASPVPTGATTTEFYLRAWYTQSLPPEYTFSWLPPTTISDGTYINGNVAIPAIYPGPLLIIPFASSISEAGIATIIDQATRLGLLGDKTDFTGDSAKPGAKLGQLEIVIDGKSYELTGDPDLQIVCVTTPCEGAPGSPEAFAAFWRDVTTLDMWLPDELGKAEQYDPERLAVRFNEVDLPTYSPPATLGDWPLDDPLAAGDCLVLEGEDLAKTLPVLEPATQLTVFAQGGDWLQPTARVLVPGEPSPCED